MTTVEMIQNWRIHYDIVNLEGPGYEDEEILVFLNQAQDIEVMNEVSLKRWTYISKLIWNEKFTVTTGSTDFAIYRTSSMYPVDAQYIGYVASRTNLIRSTFKPITTYEWVPNILIRKEDAGAYWTNTLNSPILLQPRIYEDTDLSLIIIYDKYTTLNTSNNIWLEYVSKAPAISVTVDPYVNDIMHERIVNTAVDIAKKVWNPQEAAVSQQADMLMNKPQA